MAEHFSSVEAGALHSMPETTQQPLAWWTESDPVAREAALQAALAHGAEEDEWRQSQVDPYAKVRHLEDPSEGSRLAKYINAPSYGLRTEEKLRQLDEDHPGLAHTLTSEPFKLRFMLEVPDQILIDQHTHAENDQVRAGAVIVANQLGKDPYNHQPGVKLEWNRLELANLHASIRSYRHNTDGSPVQLRLFHVSRAPELTAALNAGRDWYGRPWEFAVILGHGGEDGRRLILNDGDLGVSAERVLTDNIQDDALQPGGQALLISCGGGNPELRTDDGYTNVASHLARGLGRTVIASPKDHTFDNLSVTYDENTGLLQPRMSFIEVPSYHEIEPVVYAADGTLIEDGRNYRAQRSYRTPWHGYTVTPLDSHR